jgi:hypothetical protein
VSVRVVKPLPPPNSLLGALDLGAQATMKAAQAEIAPIVSAETPHKTGEMAAALRPRLGRTSTGRSLTVGAPRGRKHGRVTLAEVVKWVNDGTGLYRVGGGAKHRIRAKNPLRRMTLPGGAKRWSVKGQHPNAFMARIEIAGTSRVEAVMEQGAVDAARAAERVFG